MKKLRKSIWALVRKRKTEVFVSAVLVISLFASTLTTIDRKQTEELWQKRREKEARVERLVDLSIKYPDYRDLLYRLAIAQWELGNDVAARDAFERARYLDPNNPFIAELANQLGLQASGQ